MRANLKTVIEESGAVVTYDDPLPTVHGDETQLVQLFQNLIGNGIKFRGDRPPQIDVSARRDGDHWVFAVRDNGIGIERQYWEQIFVIFQRLHTRQKYAGHRHRAGRSANASSSATAAGSGWIPSPVKEPRSISRFP